MTIRQLLATLAAAMLAFAPIAVQAAPVARAAAPAAQESELGGSLLWIAIVIGVIIGAILLLDDKNDPVSP